MGSLLSSCGSRLGLAVLQSARLALVAGLGLLATGAGASATHARPHHPGNICHAQTTDVVCTQQGAVQGIVENGTRAFKGIPYAQPPVGPLRWRPPAPPRPWQGVRGAAQFGAVCPQLAGQDVVGQEDCLTLNVWTPVQARGRALPVMVFLPGGGNHSYSGQGATIFGGVRYNGERLVPEDVIVVTFNYRIGALGFLAHPGLSAERPEGVSGNYGSLDQIAMLRWLQDNIAAFGGDRKRVMLFGTSAGGGNICALMTSPAARGLFHRAAMQSSVPTGCELPTLAQAENGTGRQVAQALGCDVTTTDGACLRAKSTEDIVRAVPGTFGVLPRVYGPNVDGLVFPDQPRARIARRQHDDMPVIIGNSTLETNLFVNGLGPVPDEATYAAALTTVFKDPAAVSRILAVYPASGFASPRDALVRATTDAYFTCQSRRVARLLAKAQREPVYRYLFTHALNNDAEQKALGAVHTVEHPFFFSWQGSYRPDQADLSVQRLMVAHWTQLAKEGDLRVRNIHPWPAVGRKDLFLTIGPRPAIRAGDAGAQCDFWDTVELPQPHL